MRPTFEDNFSFLHISSSDYYSNGWVAHTPWGGDFGDAIFSDPVSGFPFRLQPKGGLQIVARKDTDGRWRSGLLASADSTGKGFAQTYGYFEINAQLPKGEGTWPAFWLMSKLPRGSKEPAVEIDALEHYGKFPADFHSGIHVWNVIPSGVAVEHVTKVSDNELYQRFHRFGVDVEVDKITFYFDRHRTWDIATPPQHTKPLLLLLDLALGSGWPIDKTPNPSIMNVESVKVFSKVDLNCR